LWVTGGAVLATTACGQSFSSGSSSGDSSVADSGGGVDARADTGADVGADAAPRGDSGSGTTDAPPPLEARSCPSLQGLFRIVGTTINCNAPKITAEECITERDCAITITPLSGGATAAWGLTSTAPIPIDPSGDFVDAGIDEGTAMRSGCTGKVSKAGLLVDCGGTDSSQSCVVTLQRMSGLCPPMP
jgi:hypothetical protein